MKSRRTIPMLTAALALTLAVPLTVRTAGTGKDDDKNKAPQDAIVNFGDPVTLVGAGNQVLVPSDTTSARLHQRAGLGARWCSGSRLLRVEELLQQLLGAS